MNVADLGPMANVPLYLKLEYAVAHAFEEHTPEPAPSKSGRLRSDVPVHPENFGELSPRHRLGDTLNVAAALEPNRNGQIESGVDFNRCTQSGTYVTPRATRRPEFFLQQSFLFWNIAVPIKTAARSNGRSARTRTMESRRLAKPRTLPRDMRR